MVWFRSRALAVWCSLAGMGLASCSGGGGGGGETVVIVVTATPLNTATPSPRSATLTPTHTVLPEPSASPTPSPLSPTISPTIGTATRTPTEGMVCPTFEIPTPEPTATWTQTPLSTPTPTVTPLIGPVVTAIEIADAGGQFNLSVGSDARGRPVYSRSAGAGFILFVEGRPGFSQLPVSPVTFNPKRNDPGAPPDLQVQVDRALGDGSSQVCDNSSPVLGGVPSTAEGDFSPELAITDALNDFGCRFRVYTETDFACTQDSGNNFVFRSPSSTIQFCTLISDALTFPPGDTIVSARLRDIAGNAGPPAQIVVRVPE